MLCRFQGRGDTRQGLPDNSIYPTRMFARLSHPTRPNDDPKAMYPPGFITSFDCLRLVGNVYLLLPDRLLSYAPSQTPPSAPIKTFAGCDQG
jgi:hypothetical protein